MKLQLLTFPKKYSEFASRANAYLKEVVRDEDYMPTEGGLLNALGFSLIDYNNFVSYISNPSAKEYIDAHMRGKYGDEMLGKAEEIVEYITTLKCWAYAVFQERFANSTSYELKNYAKSSRLATMKADWKSSIEKTSVKAISKNDNRSIAIEWEEGMPKIDERSN